MNSAKTKSNREVICILFACILLEIITGSSVRSLAETNCVIQNIDYLWNDFGRELFYDITRGFKCDITSTNFTFDLDKNDHFIKNQILDYIENAGDDFFTVEINWSKKLKQTSLTRQFNMFALLDYFTNYEYYIDLKIMNLQSIELSLIDGPLNSLKNNSLKKIYLINSDLRFSINGDEVKNCENISLLEQANKLNISSLFQIPMIEIEGQVIYIFGCRFSQIICPLVFRNSNVQDLYFFDLVNTFYKTNLIRFTNETFNDLNATIKNLLFFRCQNLALETQFLHLSVFRELKEIYNKCFITSISRDLFTLLKKLYLVKFQTFDFRKLIHRGGIEWIKNINKDIHVNLSNFTDILESKSISKYIILNAVTNQPFLSMSEVFPDKDFYIYKDYPFKQMVFTYQLCKYCDTNKSMEPLIFVNPYYSCTYLWINQYYYLLEYFYPNDTVEIGHLLIFLNSNSYKNRNNCYFERRLALCNRSEFYIRDIWGIYDYFILSKKIQIGVKAIIYIVSLFSITTNTLVIKTIFSNKNKQVFKDFKHYKYLSLISVFSLCISLIEILSWLSECFYPFEVFCLPVHKTVVAQLFKIVFKGCLVTCLKFMSNFCYLAFALNRIALIDQKHGKFIQFMSKLAIWKYVLFSLLISLAFSWIKYFKYTINYEHDEINFPIWNELDISSPNGYIPFILKFFMIYNVISDLVNYLVFVIVCFFVDIKMLIKFKTTVKESLERIKSMGGSNEKQFEKKKSDLEDAVNKNVKMVILNTTIGLLFKIPLVFLPIVNTIAIDIYKYKNLRNKNPYFDLFYTFLLDANFYSLIHDAADLLYLISVSIQYFIYNTFDTKFKEVSQTRKLKKMKKSTKIRLRKIS